MTGFMYLILFFLAGVAEAHMDTLQFHFHRSKFSYFKNQQYWNPNISWKNKYKLGDPRYGALFPGSTTIFVFLTDGWHIMKFYRNLFIFVGIYFIASYNYGDLKVALICTIIARVVYGVAFSAFMHILLRD